MRLNQSNLMTKLSKREKSIIAGLFLSKFDIQGLQYLGFSSFTESFNVIGSTIGVKPASIKNYRDEFDPFFPNQRKGWHKREIRQHCRKVLESFQHIEIEEFVAILKQNCFNYYELETISEEIDKRSGKHSSFAKRLITGHAAEAYFKNNYKTIDVFNQYKLEDTTKFGCGFDFKLNNPHGSFLGIEVKGLSLKSGTISLTDKEYTVAQVLKDRYFLFIVKNFNEMPQHDFIQNPLQSNLSFLKKEKTVFQVTWQTVI